MIFEKRGRDKLYIIAEILAIAKDGTLKTQIMYRANLSFTQLNDYVDLMLKIRLLERNRENHKKVYRTTDKGMEFLRRYWGTCELLASEEVADERESMSIQVKKKRVA